MIRFRRKRAKRIGITHFGLEGHEIAVLKSTMESTPDLAAGYELRDPNDAGSCGIVVINKDSKVATSWWNSLKKRNPTAVPMFLTDTKQAPDDTAYCKRPFSPSFVNTAFRDLVSKNAV